MVCIVRMGCSAGAIDVFATQHVFDGFKFTGNMSFSEHFSTAHTMHMSNDAEQAGYSFAPTFVSKDKLSETEVGSLVHRVPRPATHACDCCRAQPRSIVLGNIRGNGNMLAQAIHMWNSAMRSKFVFQTMNDKWVYALETDYFAKDYTVSAKAVNASLVDGSGNGSLSYLQALTPRLAVGSELSVEVRGRCASHRVRRFSADSGTTAAQWPAGSEPRACWAVPRPRLGPSGPSCPDAGIYAADVSAQGEPWSL
jgi:hypothetical protein